MATRTRHLEGATRVRFRRFARLRWLPRASAASRRPSVLVVEPTEHRERNDLSTIGGRQLATWNWHPLIDALGWPPAMEIRHPLQEHRLHVRLAEHKDVSEALAADAKSSRDRRLTATRPGADCVNGPRQRQRVRAAARLR